MFLFPTNLYPERKLIEILQVQSKNDPADGMTKVDGNFPMFAQKSETAENDKSLPAMLGTPGKSKKRETQVDGHKEKMEVQVEVEERIEYSLGDKNDEKNGR